jgi:hypothetical protein
MYIYIYIWCMPLHKTCACRLTGLPESVQHSERLRRDAACQPGALQQRASSAAPLDEAAGVCVLIHVGVVSRQVLHYDGSDRLCRLRRR